MSKTDHSLKSATGVYCCGSLTRRDDDGKQIDMVYSFFFIASQVIIVQLQQLFVFCQAANGLSKKTMKAD